jgi:hypothetical protein
MNRSSTPRSIALVAMLALAAAATTAGCAKKITTPDAGRTTVEGLQNANARLVSWTVQDVPFFELGSDVNGYFVSATLRLPRTTPDAVHFQILDRTAASKFEVFRRAPNGGLLPLFDHAIAPKVKWLDTQWEAYGFTTTPGPADTNTAYVARGLVAGVVTPAVPLTNVVALKGAVVRQTLQFDAPRQQPDSSQVDIQWTSDSRAAGYWLEVVPFDDLDTLSTPYAQMNEATPVTEPPGARRALHMFIPAPASPSASVSMSAANAELISRKMIFFQRKAYLVRVCAVDEFGRVINRIKTDYRRVPADGNYYYPMGGVVFGFFTQDDISHGRGLKYGFLNAGDLLVPWSELPH